MTSNALTVLVVDDEHSIRVTLKMLLDEAGYRTLTAQNTHEAMSIIHDDLVDVIVTDLKMPGQDGIGLLREVLAWDPSIEIIMMSAYSDVGSAVKAIKMGAFDYVIKSFQNEELLLTVEKAIAKRKLILENERMRKHLDGNNEVPGYVFRDRRMQAIVQSIGKISKSRATVLLTGESGTGKEVLAHIIHDKSPRKDGKFAVIDCSSIPESLIGSELFGYEKGAFTGADTRKIGKFEAANGGTVFLDEMAELPLSMQSSFLRVLQERKFERVGGTVPVEVDVRIIAATNKDLEKEVKEGRFREDLFYRLNICRVNVPPLRQRRDDIPALAERFLESFSKEYNKKLCCLGTDALLYLLDSPLQGNIRELKNAIEQAVILADDDEEIFSLRTLSRGPDGTTRTLPAIPEDGSPLVDYERYVIGSLMIQYKGNKNKVATVLGIRRQTLYNKLQLYGILY